MTSWSNDNAQATYLDVGNNQAYYESASLLVAKLLLNPTSQARGLTKD